MQKHIKIYKNLVQFTKDKRKEGNLTQSEFGEKVGITLTVARKIEQGKDNLSLTKVNQALLMFGDKLVPASIKEIEKWEIRNVIYQKHIREWLILLQEIKKYIKQWIAVN